MKNEDIAIIRSAIQLLQHLAPNAPRAADFHTSPCPVLQYLKNYLCRDPDGDMSCAELWRYYAELAAAGQAEPLTRSVFSRALPDAMAVVYGVRKSHAIRREDKNVRGFRGISVKMDE